MFALFNAHKHIHTHSQSHIPTDFCLFYILQQIQEQSSLQKFLNVKKDKNIT